VSYLERAKRAETRYEEERKEGYREVKREVPPYAGDAGNAVSAALRFLAMPLATFASHGACIEVRVPWLVPTVWLVPTDRDVAGLMHAGVSRGRIWTAHELRQLLALGTMTPPDAQTLAKTKLALDGSIEEVRPRVDQPSEPRPPSSLRLPWDPAPASPSTAAGAPST
jgi:hypothetical protein